MSLVVRKPGKAPRRGGRRGKNSGVPLAQGPDFTFVQAPKGFPKKMFMSHEYRETKPIVCTTGAISSYVFTCNGMYDPNITGTGHQPMYFDQMSAIYDHYTVFKSEIVYEFIVKTADQMVGTYIDDDASITNDPVLCGELPTGSSNLLSVLAAKPLTIRKTWDAKAYFGGDIFDNDVLQGSASANPTEQSYYVVVTQPFDGTSSTTLYMNVCIKYHAVWDELKNISSS